MLTMSGMTQSLLLEAQSLRLDGDLDASIDLLRVVLTQCNSDVDSAVEDDDCADGGGSIATLQTTQRLRRVAVYQLALLLLQRSGRCSHGSTSYHLSTRDDGQSDNERDEHEADTLLWKLGYQLRLSKSAFGYPTCDCKHLLSTEEHTSELPLVVIDDVLPSTLFEALSHSFRSDSRYWSQFYYGDEETSNDSSNSKGRNQFVSLNIELPQSHISYTQQVRNDATSLLQQTAIIVHQRIQHKFPSVKNATSVEVWSHQRPSDGHHQLHYDLDEVRLWEWRKERSDRNFATEKDATNADGRKRRRTVTNNDTTNVGGISCPLVSCVLTIAVPNHTEECTSCNRGGKGAPTLVCKQSILSNPHLNECNLNSKGVKRNNDTTGWLCYPRSNRLLCFEGSKLHGVVPGIPSESPGPENDASLMSEDRSDEGEGSKRITLMLGFWGDDVQLSPPNTVGPNVPLSPSSSWVEEFRAVSLDESAIENRTTDNLIPNKPTGVIRVDPLWIAVCGEAATFGAYADGGAHKETMQINGRFFLNSLDSTEIDNQVLSMD